MNHSSTNQRKIRTPQWQIDKMKTIISARWEEVWQVVVAKAQDTQSKSRSSY